MPDRDRQVLHLKDAREMTPAVNPVEAMRRQLALSVFDGVKPDDAVKLAEKLKEMAMGGDLKAMKMFFELVLPKEKAAPPPPAADSAGLKMMAEALRDLVDEVRIGKAREAKRQELVGANGANGDAQEDE